MLRFSTPRVLAVVALTLAGVLLAAPNLVVALDGRRSVLLEMDTNDLIRTQLSVLGDEVRRILSEARAGTQGGIVTAPRGLAFRLADPADRAKVVPRLRELSRPLGNAIVGQGDTGTLEVIDGPDGRIQLTLTEAGTLDGVTRAIGEATGVLRRRVAGTSAPMIERQGTDRIVVQVDSRVDPARLRDILGKTAKLQLRFVAEENADAAGVEMLSSREQKGEKVPVERRVIVGSADVVDAQPSFDQRTSEAMVSFKLSEGGRQKFAVATGENVGRKLAIVLDGEVISAPRIVNAITGGAGQISGRFTVQQANDLALLLRSGALPANLTIIEER